jgi:hypothetical protein
MSGSCQILPQREARAGGGGPKDRRGLKPQADAEVRFNPPTRFAGAPPEWGHRI